MCFFAPLVAVAPASIGLGFTANEVKWLEDIQDGLISVSTSEVDALLYTLVLCSYISELGLSNVKITGKIEFDTKLASGIQKDPTELFSILNKAINKISREQQAISDGWIKDKFLAKTDYTLVYQVIAAAVVLLSLFVFWIRRLSREINLRISTEHKLEESKKRYEALFNKTADALLIIEGNIFVDCNQSTLEMLGYETKEELYNTHPSKLSPEFQPDGQLSTVKADSMIQIAFDKGSHRFEWEHVRKNGEVFPVEVLLTAIPFEGNQLLHVVWRDITERKNSAAEIERQAYYDPLTDLPNRKLLLERLKQALITGRRHNHYGGLLFIDLDRFKSINDSLGHSIGDELLIESARRIKDCIWDEDTASRFGGDEYLVLLRHVGTDKESASIAANKIARRISEKIREPFSIKGNELHITVSIGIALFPFESQDIEDIINHADTAMYSAKQNGRNQIEFYLSKMHESVINRLTLEKDLRNAIREKRLEIYYQPLVNNMAQLVSVEALARWNHPKHGFINPEEFIAIAEDTGLIYDIGEFIMNKAVDDIMTLRKSHTVPISLSVNISPHEFRKANFIEILTNIVEKYKLEKKFLTLEVTEHIAIDNLNDTIKKFTQLKEIGVRLSLDDFGTGYSSLSHLKRLPLDELKIDRSFVFDIESDSQNALLVKSIINIAHQFNLVIVAEGVETKEQLAFLKKEKCHMFQGYYYSKPLPLDKLDELLTNGLILR